MSNSNIPQAFTNSRINENSNYSFIIFVDYSWY